MKAFDIKIIAFDKKINRYDDYGGEANRNGAGYRGRHTHRAADPRF
ncbi:hypothetical protein AiwAL_06655 [Acidiphilium sp. AL]|nr:hypothetical protein [Acidiphilium sp. AL]MCU4159785.1 hypothetical protein [Acidiphilium sp. AL]